MLMAQVCVLSVAMRPWRFSMSGIYVWSEPIRGWVPGICSRTSTTVDSVAGAG